MQWRYSISFLNTSMNSTRPRLPMLSAPLSSKHARIAFGVKIQLGNIFAADQHRGVLIVRIDRRHHADADARALGKFHRAHRKLFVFAGVFVNAVCSGRPDRDRLRCGRRASFQIPCAGGAESNATALRTSGSLRWRKTARFPRGRDEVFRPASFCPSRPDPSDRAPGGFLRL